MLKTFKYISTGLNIIYILQFTASLCVCRHRFQLMRYCWRGLPFILEITPSYLDHKDFIYLHSCWGSICFCLSQYQTWHKVFFSEGYREKGGRARTETRVLLDIGSLSPDEPAEPRLTRYNLNLARIPAHSLK